MHQSGQDRESPKNPLPLHPPGGRNLRACSERHPPLRPRGKWTPGSVRSARVLVRRGVRFVWFIPSGARFGDPA
jgi:hypothetical protein